MKALPNNATNSSKKGFSNSISKGKVRYERKRRSANKAFDASTPKRRR